MDADRWRVLEPILDRALELRADEQPAMLAELRMSSPARAEELATLFSGEKVADGDGFGLLRRIGLEVSQR